MESVFIMFVLLYFTTWICECLLPNTKAEILVGPIYMLLALGIIYYTTWVM